MAYTIDRNKITIVRGDSFAMPIMLTAVVPPSEEETTIFLKEGENLVFTVKESAYHREIPIQHVYTAADCNADGVFTIALAPEETAGMEFGSYRFDLELNLQDRKTDTVCVGDFELTEEITDRICAEKLTPTDGSAVNISVLPTEIRRFRVMPSNIKGEDGKDGHSPYIGENGNWFEFSDEVQEWVDTGVPAEIDFNNYYTKNEVDELIENIDIPEADVTKQYVDDELAKKADKNHTHAEYLTAKINDEEASAENLYSSAKIEQDFAKKTEIPTIDVNKAYVDGELAKKSDKGHTHDEYLTEDDIPAIPSINDDSASAETVYSSQKIESDFAKKGEGGGGLSLPDNAWTHNAVYRGAYLGDTVTAEQYAEIASGEFKDLYIGDYWTIDGVNWRIAAFDYYLRCMTADEPIVTHHAVIVPDTCLGEGIWQTGQSLYGYNGSTINTVGMTEPRAKIEELFAGHILTITEFFTNDRAEGMWRESRIELMTEQMLYGSVCMAMSTRTIIPTMRVAKTQLPLFRYNTSLLHLGILWWTRDVINADNAVGIFPVGSASYVSVINIGGIRPSFAIC